MHDPNKTNWPAQNLNFEMSIKSTVFFCKCLDWMLLRSINEYKPKQSFFETKVKSGRIFTSISKKNCPFFFQKGDTESLDSKLLIHHHYATQITSTLTFFLLQPNSNWEMLSSMIKASRSCFSSWQHSKFYTKKMNIHHINFITVTAFEEVFTTIDTKGIRSSFGQKTWDYMRISILKYKLNLTWLALYWRILILDHSCTDFSVPSQQCSVMTLGQYSLGTAVEFSY